MSDVTINLPPGRRRFGQYPGNDVDCYGNAYGIPTLNQAYLEGYQTGANWKYTYYPGGPWTHQWDSRYENSHRKDWYDLKAYCDATIENYEEWHRGFKDARAGRHPLLPELNLGNIAILGYN